VAQGFVGFLRQTKHAGGNEPDRAVEPTISNILVAGVNPCFISLVAPRDFGARCLEQKLDPTPAAHREKRESTVSLRSADFGTLGYRPDGRVGESLQKTKG